MFIVEETWGKWRMGLVGQWRTLSKQFAWLFITSHRIDISFPHEKDLIPQAKGTLSRRVRNRTAKTILKGGIFYNTTNFILIIID